MQKRKILITGGTGDVGRALVTEFCRLGHEVAFTYAQRDAVASELESKTGARARKLDLACARFDEIAGERYDILVNNAGINITSVSTHEVSDGDWDATLALNLTAPFRLARACLPHMVAQRWGRIVNISSIYGLRAAEGNLPYTVSKHGMAGLTRTIAKEYAQFGVTCNEICPGPITGSMMRRIALEEGQATGQPPETYLADVVAGIPAGRMASPQDIALAAVFLASDSAEYVNGVSLPVDGGLIA